MPTGAGSTVARRKIAVDDRAVPLDVAPALVSSRPKAFWSETTAQRSRNGMNSMSSRTAANMPVCRPSRGVSA